jgi:CheY-like chemotaxis protein
MFKIDRLDTWWLLVVDDDMFNASLIRSIMEFYGVRVDSAQDGKEGLKKLEQGDYNIVMLDLSMPHLDGWEMLKQIRENATLAHLPIIAFTAHAMQGDRERVLDAGFDGYIPKPIRVARLLPELKDILQNVKRERIERL